MHGSTLYKEYILCVPLLISFTGWFLKFANVWKWSKVVLVISYIYWIINCVPTFWGLPALSFLEDFCFTLCVGCKSCVWESSYNFSTDKNLRCAHHQKKALWTSHLIIMKTRLFKYIENFTTKNWKISDKNSDILFMLRTKIVGTH